MLAHRLNDIHCSYLINHKKILMKSLPNSVERTYDEPALFGIHRLKSRIVNQISHEFRTPLTSIIGFAEVLEEDVQIDEKQRMEYASYIRTRVYDLRNLLTTLLDSILLNKDRLTFSSRSLIFRKQYNTL